MKTNNFGQIVKILRVRRLFAAALTLGYAFAMATHAQAQSIPSPTTPVLITPPAGNKAFLVGHAFGTQGYVCFPTSPDASTASWTLKPPRPEATLFQNFFGLQFQIVTHFLSPDENPNGIQNPTPFGNATWQSSFDSSRVWAAVLNGTSIAPSADEPSCPNTGSIACLLLQTVGSLPGPTGGTSLSKTTFVQRLNTNGGAPPVDGCSTSTDVGNQALVPYTADYYFFRKDQ